MSAPAARTWDPSPDSDPRAYADANALLDLFETNVRALQALGMEPQMRARIERLLPIDPPTTASPTVGAPLGREDHDPIDLSVVLTALTGRDPITVARAKRWLRVKLRPAVNSATRPEASR